MDKAAIKILVVEDEELLRDILALVLSDEGYQVEIATNGEEAWEKLNDDSYDLLATDLFMPKMNGFELVLKVQRAFPGLKIIMISGGGKEVEAIDGNNVITYQEQTAEVDVFLKKPYSIELLLSRVEQALTS